MRLFGGASIETDSGPLSGPAVQRRRLALLALLAAAPAGGVSRDRLVALLFPEADSARAHHALSDALHAVRKALGRQAVLSTGDALRLNEQVVTSDLAEFERAVEAGDVERLADAARIYRGPFLDGFFVPDAAELERWIEAERARLASSFASALEALAEHDEQRGGHRQAVEWWTRLAAHDPYSSRIVVRLARALVASGDFAAALRVTHAHRERLSAELEIDADPQVSAVIAQFVASWEAGSPRTADPPEAGPAPGQLLVARQADTVGSDHANPAAAHSEHAAPRSASPRRAAMTVVAVGILAGGILAVAAWWSGERGSRVAAEGKESVAPDARELYLRGRQAWSERSADGLERAVVYFRRATERDPSFAPAYAGLADAYVILGYLGFRPADAMFPKGKAAALRALELDSTLAGAYAPLGQALMWEHDWRGAERAFRTAVTLDPDHATAHQWYGILMCALGRIREAVEHTRRASALDPLSRQISNTYGMMLHYAGDSVAALALYRQSLEAEPDSVWVRQNPWLLSNASRVFTAHGLYGDALRALGHALGVAPRHPRLLWDLASTYVAMEQPQRALAVFAAADTANGQYAYFRAAMFAVLGESDSAFHWLDRVEEWGPGPVSVLRMDPQLAPIRTDPRYEALLRRLRLVE